MLRLARWSVLLALGAGMFLPERIGGETTPQDALPYSTSYLITGNYVAGGVDVQSSSEVDGFVTGTINMSGVPANADILAAFLYWESIYEVESQIAGVEFRGAPIPAVKKSPRTLTPDTPCWATGSNLQMAMFRADVLPFLPVQKDGAGKKTGKRLVNSADLAASGLAPHTVKLPQGGGNLAPESAGASLVVVYRDPAEPLRKIVFYDGIYVQPMGGAMTQHLRGFYQSAATASAKMTHLVGSGAKNQTETLAFNDQALQTNVFPEADASSDRGWFTRTDDVSDLMSLNTASDGQYGESATTSVTHANNNPYECLAWGAIIFSTAVKDDDDDGLPDGLEDADGGLVNPNGEPLPNLSDMGAHSSHRDIFVEFNAMRADPGTPYGSVPDPDGHNHLPTPEVLKMVGDVYAARGITPHFDVGDVTAYHALGGDYASTDADAYLVATGASGGELILEKACVPTQTVKCQFPAYPGTVAWKFGLQEYRDAPVGSNGEELTPAQEDFCRANPANAACGRRRFDRIRSSLFHYALYAHARAKPKSPFPCLDGSGQVAEYVNGVCAVAPNPDFHIPKSTSGAADLPGGNLMITLGLWDNYVGTPFVQASTTLHELGHNLNLGHGGLLAEANCKPNYLSSMSYLFQVHGLFRDDDDGSPHLDYSGSAHWNIDENALSDGALGPVAPVYRPAWFVPSASPLAGTLGASAATKFCSGSKFNPAAPPTPLMARVEAESAGASIDWHGDGPLNTAAPQNVNFDATFFDGVAGGVQIMSSALSGFDDWSNVRLNQIGAGRAVARFLSFDGSSFEGSSFEGSSFEGSSFEGSSFEGSSFEGSSFEGSSFEGSSFEGSSFEGSSFEGSSFEGSSFEGSSFEGSSFEGQELDAESAKALGRTPPHALKACVIGVDCAQGSTPLHRTRLAWKAPNLGAVAEYRLRRVQGAVVVAGSTSAPAGTTATTAGDDETELPHGVQFTYFVRALFADGTESGASNVKTITAVNLPPVAVGDGSYVATQGGTLTVAAPGVLANDTDPDSAASSMRAVLVAGPSNGAFTLSADGSFTYTPTGCGPDSFQYQANNGLWTDLTTPMNAVDSNVVTVTIAMSCAPLNNPPVANPDSGTVVAGKSATINVLANDSDADGHALTVTGVTQGAQGTVTFSSPNVTYTASPSFVGTDSFTYTISDNNGGTATGTVTMTVGYGFLAVQNLPPAAGKTFNSGVAVPLLWKYTNAAGVAIDSRDANPAVIVTPVAVSGQLPPGWTGDFTVADPGSSSFQLPTAKNGWTWQFNWKLVYMDPATGTTRNLPGGTYRVIIKSQKTGQQNPVVNGVLGAVITVK